MENASNLVVPLWGAISVSCAALVGIAGGLAWIFATFSLKRDSDYLELRVKSLEANSIQVGRDVSFIRGLLERNNGIEESDGQH